MNHKKAVLFLNFYKMISARTQEDIHEFIHDVINKDQYEKISQAIHDMCLVIDEFIVNEIDSIREDSEILEKYTKLENNTFEEYLNNIKE